MLLIHRGAGPFVLLSGVIAALVMNVVTNALYDNDYYSQHVWPKFGTFWLAGGLCVAIGAYLKRRPGNVPDDDWIPNESAHHLFFIPVRYWGVVYFAAGVVFVIYKLSKGLPTQAST